MSGTPEAGIIRAAGGLHALEPEWWTLWRRIPSATPFQSPAWLLPWWESFSPGELSTAYARLDGRLVGLAPFYRETGPLGARLLPVGISISDYLDILLDPDVAEPAAKALTHAIADELGWQDWELAELGPCAQASALPRPPLCEERTEEGEPCPYLRLPERAEELRAAFPSRKRRALAMNSNRAKRRGPLTFYSLKDCPAERLLAELVRLHGSRWQSRGEAGVLGDSQVTAFHEMALPRLVAAGLARLYALSIGDDIAAVYYGFLHHGRAYGYLTGIDPAFAHESPGTLLLAHVMEEAIREGAHEFDFLRGGEPYKYGWGAQGRWNRRRTFSRRRAHAAA
jgi:CelD/BcsL family acetyltransferase involved in cellulose biosynthesis